MTFEIENNHANKAVVGFAMPFWGKPRWAALMVAIANEIQEVENALFDALVMRQLPNATGVRLRVLARLVGQPVKDFSEDDLRRLISVRIAANRSEGRWDDILRILLLWGLSVFDLSPAYPAGLRLDIEEVRSDAKLLAEIVIPAVAAGVDLEVVGPPPGGDWNHSFALSAPGDVSDPLRGLAFDFDGGILSNLYR